MSKGAIIGLVVGVVAVIVIIFVFMGGAWSQEEQDAYMNSCTMSATEEQCQCTMDYLMDLYPDPEDMLTDPGAGQAVLDAALECY